MHHAPAVDYPLTPRATVERWVLALWIPGAMAIIHWSWLAFSEGGWKWLGLAAGIAAASTAMATRNRIAQGNLDWDGLNWTWSKGGHRSIGEVVLELDLQVFMMLVFVPAERRERRAWMFLGGRGVRWTALRRAVIAARGGSGGGGDGPGAGVVDGIRSA
ncbi:MAG: hypothetical protein ABIN37_00175 [Burkholderiaceae bacterium]